MPVGASSLPRALVKPTTPCLEAEYGAPRTTPCLPAVDAMLMIRPQPRSRMPPVLSTSRVTRKTLLRLVSMTSSHSSSAMSAVTPPPLRPALLTRTSTVPKWSTAARTKVRTASGERTSTAAPSASMPSSWSCLTVAATLSASRAPMNTRCPAEPNCRAAARPMPLVAPVISATRCVCCGMLFNSLDWGRAWNARRSAAAGRVGGGGRAAERAACRGVRRRPATRRPSGR